MLNEQKNIERNRTKIKKINIFMLFGKKKTTKPAEPKAETVQRPETAVSPARATRLAHRILIRPIISEKATNLEILNKYVFEVPPDINKIEIGKAIKELYNVDPIRIHIVKVKGKLVRYGKTSGRTKKWKKSIITLKKGDKIEFTKK